INDGTDNNTLLDNCDRTIPVNEQIPFQYVIPQPILADSLGNPRCAPNSILVYYPKKIQCSTVSPGGSDFSITGSSPVTITGAYGNCVNDLSNYIVIKLSSPIYTQGNYTLLIRPGIDGSPIYDLCGQPILPQTLSFSTVDTVNADFSYTNAAGCRQDTLSFSHNGANGVTSWNWIFNNGTPVTTSSNTVIFPASSTNTVQLIVSNGVCRDTSTQTIVLDNEVKAAFTIPGIICPEDSLTISNTSTGQVSLWQWSYNNTLFSNLQDPLPFLFPFNNRETIYLIKLVASNTTLHCSDSTTQSIKVLDNCYIGVPTAFTPNGDGLNDYFWPHNAIKADNLDFKVFNRWGQMVFHSKNWQQKWDGTLKGIPQGSGTYVWMLQYSNRDTGKTVFQKGTVVLIR
ncbi:MAG: gliding motility-associated C-terminal domain-containing protein, partial [Bacteroidetes bacterium]|nr:gliding motility-associated C-terminal domain-containing protein [Bacteroidota bacterium]